MTSLEVLFSPAEFETLSRRDLSRTTCVVFDILRATSTLITALDHGAEAILPVASIEEAIAQRAKDPNVVLAGERDGFRIQSARTGSVDFDFGNSPREFTPERVARRKIIMTTTNGTRALRACEKAERVFAGSFLNLGAVAERLCGTMDLLLVCSGTHQEASFEDTLAAGALVDCIWSEFSRGHIADSAQIARLTYRACMDDLPGAMQLARNGKRLLGIPELRDDVIYCLRRDSTRTVATTGSEGWLINA